VKYRFRESAVQFDAEDFTRGKLREEEIVWKVA